VRSLEATQLQLWTSDGQSSASPCYCDMLATFTMY
jgi:hypothetical protein